jgi:porin
MDLAIGNRSSYRAAIVILVILGWAAAAQAEDATSAPAAAKAEDTLRAPAASRALAETPFQLVLPRGHLLGDWLGTRTWLEDRGIYPLVTYVIDALGNPIGGREQGFRGASNLGVDLVFDFEKLFGVDGGTFAISFSERFGSSLSEDNIGNVFTVQQVFGGQTYRLVDLAYKQKLLNDRVELRVGRIAAGDDFLVSPYDYLFVQNAFDGNPVGIFFNAPGMTAYPNATWGGLVKVRPTERTYVMAGAYNGDASIRANNRHGADFSMDGPVFVIGEVGYQINGLPGDRGLLGNYKAGFWYDDHQYVRFNTVARAVAPGVSRGNWGFYGMFDQVLVRFGEPGSGRGFGIISSLLISPDQSISVMPFFGNVGLAARGVFESRPTDVLALGVVHGRFGDDLQDSQRRARASDPSVGLQRYETALELTYRFRFLKNSVYFAPDLQYIIRPGGTGRIPDAFVVGFEAGINF